MTVPRSETISTAQVTTLQTIARMTGPAACSSRTSETKRTVATASARALAGRGLVAIDDDGMVTLTEQGSAFLGIRHVDTTPLHDRPAYKAGVALAVRDRRTAVNELQEALATLEPGAPGYEFARHQVARFRQLDQQEGIQS